VGAALLERHAHVRHTPAGLFEIPPRVRAVEHGIAKRAYPPRIGITLVADKQPVAALIDHQPRYP
jgi:hypothetical protein